MDIGIIGSGNIGSTLARHLKGLGHQVSIANSRGAPAGTPGRISLSVAGDDKHAKELTLGLIDAIGFDGVDAGSLADSWRQQPGTPAYCQDLDAAGLEAALAKADAAQIPEYRAQADEAARPYF